MTILSKCLLEEAKAISQAAEKLNHLEVQKAIEILEKCGQRKNKLLVTGVGKSGIVARKIAATFSSIGLVSVYLNPVDALHGDLGIVGSEDVCILISNSGETKELLEIIPHLKLRKSSLIALVGNTNSSIAKKSDSVLEATVDKETCPLNLAPTASTSVAMAIGDALATVWMEKNKVSTEEFAKNHPAGQIGKKLTFTISELMVPIDKIEPIYINSTLEEIIIKISSGGIGITWVQDFKEDKKVIGVITDGDLRRGLQKSTKKRWQDITAKDIMTKNPVTINDSASINETIDLMECNSKKPISAMPVLKKDNEIIGIIRLHDLIQTGLV
ncbi:KpsF/GutQ family sugar-phosphate isomerase [Prochlorococcus sp. AH-736-E15]|nr:KpsF/GutQ family sugar-phosphate isomerase [Prochlorococcus sp. AH-736-E15]